MKENSLSRRRCILCRTPSRGAWIESFEDAEEKEKEPVAPPRGVRGLKDRLAFPADGEKVSHPLAGCVD